MGAAPLAGGPRKGVLRRLPQEGPRPLSPRTQPSTPAVHCRPCFGLRVGGPEGEAVHTLALGPSLPQGHTCSLPRDGVQGVSAGRMGGWCDYGLSPRRVSRSPQGLPDDPPSTRHAALELR